MPRSPPLPVELCRLYHKEMMRRGLSYAPAGSRGSAAGLPFQALLHPEFELCTPFAAALPGMGLGQLAWFWQLLAAVAFAGLLLVTILAIIEPGPLANRRAMGRRGSSELGQEQDELPGEKRNGEDKEGAPESVDGSECPSGCQDSPIR